MIKYRFKMKTLKTHIKLVALFFSVLLMLQSCTVYKSAPITLDEASKANNKVRVYNKNGEKLTYSKIVVFNDGHYYGVKKAQELSNNS